MITHDYTVEREREREREREKYAAYFDSDPHEDHLAEWPIARGYRVVQIPRIVVQTIISHTRNKGYESVTRFNTILFWSSRNG